MKNKRKPIILLLAFLSCLTAFPQKSILRGRVFDKNDNQTIVGANIIEYDKDNRIINGTITDVNGDFVFEMQNPANIIKVSLIGYETKEVKPDFTKSMVIILEVSSQQLEEVVVTAQARTFRGLTNIEDRDNASARVKVDMMDMKESGVLTASDALQGRVSGLDIISSSGDPGSGSSLVIRGLSSIGNNKPLIVVDGIPQSDPPNYSDFNLSSANTEDIGNLINIAVQDIKSIEILKDAAATAVYGSRGADGVLIIETHKGKLGKVQFDYTYKNSINIQPPAIPMLNGDEYIMLQLEEWHNSQGIFELPPEIAYDIDYVDFYNYSANTDWLGAITKNGVTHDHYFSIQGGGEKTRYFTSLSFVDEGGTTLNTRSKRFSTRVNLDYYLSRQMVFSIQFNYTYNNTKGNIVFNKGEDNEMTVRKMAYIKSPNMSIWEHDAYGNLTGEYFTPINSYQGNGESFFNPLAVAELGKDDRLGNNLTNAFTLRYNILDWLVFRETISFQFDGSKSNNFLPYNALGSDWLAWTVNKAEESNNIFRQITTETQLAFDSPFKSKTHFLSGALTWITEQSGYEWMNIQSNKTPSTNIQDPSIDAQINWIGDGSGEERLLGALANLNYKLLDRYMVQTTYRVDAHSSFGANNRWGSFTGLSGAWRFSGEPFLQDLSFMGESMLRVSWGVSGRQPSDPYSRFARYGASSSGNYITNPAIVPSQTQLNNLKWETITSSNIGLELNLFNDRFYLEGEIYQKTTTDLLFEKYQIPRSSGYEQFLFLNGGKLENKGWELMTEFRFLQKKDMRLSFNFNISQNINAFTELPDNFNPEQSTSIGNKEYPIRVLEGEPIGSFFGFRYQGVYPSDADAVARDVQGNVLFDNEGVPIPMTYLNTYIFKGGDPVYEDVNHDGKIDLNDVVYLGDANPKYIGGFGTAVRYRNFDLTCGFQYRLGYDIINGVAMDTEGMNDRNNQSKAVLSRWRVQGQDEPGMLPRAYLNHPANNLGSDRYVERGDFLRLLNIMISYRAGKKMCDMLKLRTLTFAASARKILTFTNYSGQDPEVPQNASNPFWIGVDKANTPPPRVITFTVSVGF